MEEELRARSPAEAAPLTAESRRVMANVPRGKAIQAYKNLLYLGKNYPKGYDHFRTTLRQAFEKNRQVTDPQQIEKLLGKCDNIAKELRTLYMLRQYKHVNKRCQEDPKKSRMSSN